MTSQPVSDATVTALAERYARHRLVPGWRQAALADATVAVIGVGALGNEVARVLAMAGVGELVLCDPDLVAESNLSRCALFRAADVGRLKVATAAAALADLAPGIRIRTRATPLDAGIGLADLRDLTLVIGCLDSIAGRVQLAQRCALVGAGWLDGGTQPWGGEVRRFTPGGACYGCLVGAPGRAMLDNPVGCGALLPPAEAGASAPVSALVGALMATSAVRLICGLPLGPEAVLIDAATGLCSPLTLPPAADCPLHTPLRVELIKQVPLGPAAGVSELLELIEPDEDIATWRDFDADDRQPAAGPSWLPEARPATTFLRRAAPDATLRELGVPPREILTVLHRPTAQSRFYLELAAGDPTIEDGVR